MATGAFFYTSFLDGVVVFFGGVLLLAFFGAGLFPFLLAYAKALTFAFRADFDLLTAFALAYARLDDHFGAAFLGVTDFAATLPFALAGVLALGTTFFGYGAFLPI